ncbi:MAG: hypothetical protein WA981_13705, partial [Glaciecola sp.]
MRLNTELVKRVFTQPKLMLDMPEPMRAQLIIVLRQQKVLAKLAYILQANDLLTQIDVRSQRHFLNALRIALRQKEQVELEATELTNILKNESDFVVFLKGAA